MERPKLTDNPLFRFLTVVLLPAVLLIILRTAGGSYYESVLILFFINVILAASLNLTNGITGIFSLGHAAFMALGAYISSILTLSEKMKQTMVSNMPEWLAKIQLPFVPAVLTAAVITMLIAGLIGLAILRAKGHYLAVITLGMVIVIKSVLDNASNLTNGSRGLSGMAKYSTLPVVIIAALLTLYILYRIRISAFGRSMVALREDEDAATSLGISYRSIRLLSFMVSTFFAAVGGALWAHLQRTIAPSLFYFNETFVILEMSVLGGMASLSGAIPGAAILTFLPQILANFSTGFTIFGVQIPQINGLTNIVMSILFIVTIIFRKQGVVGNSEYIVSSLFDPKTYTGLFKKKTYEDFAFAFRRKQRSTARRLNKQTMEGEGP